MRCQQILQLQRGAGNITSGQRGTRQAGGGVMPVEVTNAQRDGVRTRKRRPRRSVVLEEQLRITQRQ